MGGGKHALQGKGLFDERYSRRSKRIRSGIPLVYLQDRLVHQYLDECFKKVWAINIKNSTKMIPNSLKGILKIRVMELQKFYQAKCGGKA